MLHVISARCVARNLHTIAPGPLEHACWRQFAALWGDCKKSRIALLNAIIIIIIKISSLDLIPRGQERSLFNQTNNSSIVSREILTRHLREGQSVVWAFLSTMTQFSAQTEMGSLCSCQEVHTYCLSRSCLDVALSYRIMYTCSNIRKVWDGETPFPPNNWLTAMIQEVFKNAELPTVTFWPYFDTVTLKMYGNTVC